MGHSRTIALSWLVVAAALVLSEIAVVEAAANFFPANLFITDECFNVYFYKHDFLNQACFKKTLSKVVSYSIIVLSGLLKVPIIVNMLKAKSGSGLSPSSLYLELASYVVMVVYHLQVGTAFSAWGEIPIILFQNALMVIMVWNYERTSEREVYFMVGVMVTLVAFGLGLPRNLKYILPSFTTICAIIGRLPQIVANFKNKHTGVLSIITQILMVAGGLARIGTLFVDAPDVSVLISFFTAILLNTTILAQIIIYKDNTKKVMNSMKSKDGKSAEKKEAKESQPTAEEKKKKN